MAGPEPLDSEGGLKDTGAPDVITAADAYGRAVEEALAMARAAAARIEQADHLELVREPGLSIVLFRRLAWQAADYQRWSRQLLADALPP